MDADRSSMLPPPVPSSVSLPALSRAASYEVAAAIEPDADPRAAPLPALPLPLAAARVATLESGSSQCLSEVRPDGRRASGMPPRTTPSPTSSGSVSPPPPTSTTPPEDSPVTAAPDRALALALVAFASQSLGGGGALSKDSDAAPSDSSAPSSAAGSVHSSEEGVPC